MIEQVAGTAAGVQLSDGGDQLDLEQVVRRRIADAVHKRGDKTGIPGCGQENSGDRVLVASGYFYEICMSGRKQKQTLLRIWKIVSPSYLELVGELEWSVAGGWDWPGNPYYYDGFIFHGDIVIDVSDPASPHKVGSFDSGGKAAGVNVRFPFAYVADGREGLRIIDVSSPTNPHEIASYPAIDHVRNVTLYDDYAYLADDRGGLIILDISDPYSPHQESIYTFPTGDPDKKNHVYDIYVQGDYAYALDFNLVILNALSQKVRVAVEGNSLPIGAQAGSIAVSGVTIGGHSDAGQALHFLSYYNAQNQDNQNHG